MDTQSSKGRLFPDIPPTMPIQGNRATRFIGRLSMRLLGWRLIGEIPKEKKLVLAVAPHTSNWDFIVAMAILLATGVKLSYLMKQEAFFWPFKNLFMSWGGIPVDRTMSEGVVDQIAEWFASHEKVWVAMTPEGTRKKVERWKTGFLRIAQRAEVPVYLLAWDFERKLMVFERAWPVSGDHAADAAAMQAHVNRHYRGHNPDYQ